MTPLLVETSGSVTVASLTMTPPSTVNDNGCPFTAVADKHSVTALAGTSPETT